MPVQQQPALRDPLRRVAEIVGKTLAPIVETNIVENLNPPSEISDRVGSSRDGLRGPGGTMGTTRTRADGCVTRLTRRAWDKFAANEMGWEYGCGRTQFGYDWTGKWRGFSDRERLLTLGPNLEAALDADFGGPGGQGHDNQQVRFHGHR